MPDTATQPASVTAAQEEQAFVDSFAQKIEANEIPQDRGRAKAEREAAEAAKSNDDESTKTDETDKDDSGKPANEGTRTGSDDTPADEDEGTDNDDKPEGTVDADAEKSKDDDATDTDEDEEPDDAELAQEAAAALEKHGVKLKLEDLPKEAQPLVQQQLKLMQAGFTRALQEARAYREEEAQFRAERAFVDQNPALVIVELLQKGGADLEAKVNELLDGASTDVGKKALEVTTREARSEVLKSIAAESQKTQRLLDRADVITTYVKTACTKLNVPFDLVEELVASRLLEKPADARDLTETELDGIIGKVQRSISKRLGERKQQERKDAIKGRQQDRKTVSPAARSIPGTGTPAPTGAKAPQNDEEFASYMAGKLSGRR